MAPLSKKTIQHFTHFHPLTKVSANTEFLCDGCRTLGFGTRSSFEAAMIRPGRCMVCKDSFSSWHYRCGICCINLHLGYVLVLCEEETMMSVPRSLKTPTPPPLASPPSFDAYYAYGFGVIPPPSYFAYAYGIPYAHGHGAPSSCGEFYEVNSYQTHSNSS
ncbi:hypothetical protein PVK06_012482 [Gossypium arboreum]|uniref:Uncharacterized protein n=1 Tax=Gossypium arboreum TaxID=29729 RepID=A0ABR0QBU9_GOSAR|nr:hypothetical protein PVK06_012482 [Gossypium arboreum]